jgi:branched-chain amino acid transport system permease protein
MKDILYFTLLGLGIGSIYGLLATGIVVAHKGAGVINFAHGALAMYAAFQFNELRTKGQLQLPIFDIIPGNRPNLPVRIELTDGRVPFALAFILAMLTAVLLGLMMHYLVFRPLRKSPPLGKVIGSIGAMLYLQGVALLNFGSDFRTPESVLPADALDNFLGLGRAFSVDRLWLFAITIVIAAVLWVFYRSTRIGLATRAAAENEKGAVVLGFSPDLVAGVNWVIAALVAGLAGVFAGPLAGQLTPSGLTLLIVPALGGALLGNLSSTLVAAIGGIALGMAETFSTGWLSRTYLFIDGGTLDWLRNGLKDSIPLIVIGTFLYVRGKGLPTRGAVQEKRLPLSPRPVRRLQWSVVGFVLVTYLAFTFTGKWSFGLSTTLCMAMLCLAFVVLTGYVGQISLAQLSMSGVAAFVMARLLSSGGEPTAQNPFPVSGPGLPWPIAMTLGIVAAVLIGVLLGLPALRIRGVQLAVVTIAAAIAIQTLYFENASLTGLNAGSNAVLPAPTFFGIDIGPVGDNGLTDNPNFIIFAVVVLILLALAVANLRLSATGRQFLAVRANERAAAATGIDVSRTKLLAFGVASGIAGVAGCMIAFQQQQISSANWTFFLGLGVLSFAYLAGITSVNGSLLGGILAPAGLIVVFSTHHFHGIENYTGAVGGLGLVLTAILHPEGQAPFFQPIMRYAGTWLVKARGPEWLGALKKFGPTALLGAVLGYLVWPLRVDTYNWWMVVLGAYLALFVRSIGKRIYGAVTGKGGGLPGHGHGPAPAASADAKVPAAAGSH